MVLAQGMAVVIGDLPAYCCILTWDRGTIVVTAPSQYPNRSIHGQNRCDSAIDGAASSLEHAYMNRFVCPSSRAGAWTVADRFSVLGTRGVVHGERRRRLVCGPVSMDA